MLPAQVWQPRTKEFQLQALTHWRAGFPPFPEAYRLVATLDVPEPEAVFVICQHFTHEGWLHDPRVRARAQSAHSMCVGDVVVTPDGALWMTTSNTDGRVDPGRDDDKVIRVTL